VCTFAETAMVCGPIKMNFRFPFSENGTNGKWKLDFLRQAENANGKLPLVF
jgi:hypothetical protein